MGRRTRLFRLSPILRTGIGEGHDQPQPSFDAANVGSIKATGRTEDDFVDPRFGDRINRAAGRNKLPAFLTVSME
jgi:hypothetical protein